MKAEEIINYAGRNLGLISSDNTRFIDGAVTKAGMLDELNRVYLYSVCQHLMMKDPDLFIAESRKELYRATGTVSAVDTVNNTLTVSIGIFGNADVGAIIYNQTKEKSLSITEFTASNQVTVTGQFDAAWIGDTIYILSNIIPLDNEILDLNSIKKVQIRYAGSGYWYESERTNVDHYKDLHDNYTVHTEYDPIHVLTNIQNGDSRQDVLMISPSPTKITGNIKITYTQLPLKLKFEDTPRFVNMGITEVLINALTAWGAKAKGDYNKAQTFEENNAALGGIVPKGMTAFNMRFEPDDSSLISFGSVWRN